jgi:ACS family hexuronate transporter-like MFS transporter
MRPFLPSILMMLVSLISYIDRQTLAQLSPLILDETHLSNAQFTRIISVFSFAYMLGNPIWGRALDRVGVFVGMALAVALWSVASAAHAFAAGIAGITGFALARAVLGFGEGATFPGGLRTATMTLPPASRARGLAIAYSGGSLGAILTPLLVTPIALRYGWRAAFLVTGGLGAVWVVLWLVCARRRPELRAPARTIYDGPRFGDRRLWSFMALYALGASPLAFVLYAAPLYLHQALHQSQAWMGRWLWLPPLGWEIGYFFWGWRIDRDRDGSRAGVRVLLLTLAGAPLLGTPWLPEVTPAPVLAALTWAMFIAAGFIITGIAYATRSFGTNQSALLAGIGAGSWSAVVAALMPLFGRLFDARRYPAAFVLAALVPAAGAALWWILERVGSAPGARTGRAPISER